MKKIIGIFIGAIIMTLFFLSCNMNSDENIEPNTPEKEQAQLKEFLDGLVAEGHDIDTTDMGIYYVVIDDGGSDIYPEIGDTLVVGYTGYFIDGTMFDTSDLHTDDGKYEFVLGEGNMIEGWDDGLKEISEGSIVQLIIPSEYAYGSEGSGGGIIPPYSTVIFVIQMFDIKKAVTG